MHITCERDMNSIKLEHAELYSYFLTLSPVRTHTYVYMAQYLNVIIVNNGIIMGSRCYS